jgi:membrane protein DedA with SNARE-associated domain
MTDGFVAVLMLKLPYIGLFAVLFVAGLGVPLPEDIPLLIAGWLVHRGSANLYAMIAVGMAGVLVGDFLLFNMGRRYGEHIIEHRFMRRVATPALLMRAEALFARHGAKIIFAARFMPGLRAVLFATAGIFRVRPIKFLLIDGSAALASVPLLIWLGERFGARLEEIARDARNAQLIAAGCLVAAIVAWCVWEYYQVKRRKRLSAEMAPLTSASPTSVDAAQPVKPPAKLAVAPREPAA